VKAGIFLKVKARWVLPYIYIAVFVVVTFLIGVALPQSSVWQYLGLSEKALIVFCMLLNFCAFLLACWVDRDDARLDILEKQLLANQNRISELEKKTK